MIVKSAKPYQLLFPSQETGSCYNRRKICEGNICGHGRRSSYLLYDDDVDASPTNLLFTLLHYFSFPGHCYFIRCFIISQLLNMTKPIFGSKFDLRAQNWNAYIILFITCK